MQAGYPEVVSSEIGQSGSRRCQPIRKTTRRCALPRVRRTLRSPRPQACIETSHARTERPRCRPWAVDTDRWEKAKSYKSPMYGDGESSGGIVPAKRSNEGLGGCRRSWREGCRPRRTRTSRYPHRTPSRTSGPTMAGAGARVGYRSTPLSKVGTVCVRSASTVLCGGCRATGIPTATRRNGRAAKESVNSSITGSRLKAKSNCSLRSPNGSRL